MSRAFEARYPGRCAACPEPIEPRDLLVYDDDGAVIHAGCRVVEPRPARPVRVCPTCMVALPATGLCDTCD